MRPSLEIFFREPDEANKLQVVAFSGDFDKAGYTEVGDRLSKFVKDFALNTLVFDFGNMKFINSEGIGYLMEVHTHMVNNGRQLVIVGANDHVKDVFNAIGIGEIISVKEYLSEITDQ